MCSVSSPSTRRVAQSSIGRDPAGQPAQGRVLAEKSSRGVAWSWRLGGVTRYTRRGQAVGVGPVGERRQGEKPRSMSGHPLDAAGAIHRDGVAPHGEAEVSAKGHSGTAIMDDTVPVAHDVGIVDQQLAGAVISAGLGEEHLASSGETADRTGRSASGSRRATRWRSARGALAAGWKSWGDVSAASRPGAKRRAAGCLGT